MKPIDSSPYRRVILLCAAGLLTATLPLAAAAPPGTTVTTVATDAIDDAASRTDTIELGLIDLRLRQEAALPSVADPLDLPPRDSPCPFLEPAAGCPERARLNPVPHTDSGSLHRLRRDVTETQDTTEARLIEEALKRMAESAPD